ncbi:MAG: hypothetical protein AC479_07990 [miscellaneous Crenarchaeota group-6 archaeon AD8-1]|nr:MAG: hypothetical protein AC479_07990 [miscellaneous Crenarchaeota group-6 archaeon AD8-1]
MEEYYNEVRGQVWFEQMLEYMEDRGFLIMALEGITTTIMVQIIMVLEAQVEEALVVGDADFYAYLSFIGQTILLWVSNAGIQNSRQNDFLQKGHSTKASRAK